jgi:hypothetical protein
MSWAASCNQDAGSTMNQRWHVTGTGSISPLSPAELVMALPGRRI